MAAKAPRMVFTSPTPTGRGPRRRKRTPPPPPLQSSDVEADRSSSSGSNCCNTTGSLRETRVTESVEHISQSINRSSRHTPTSLLNTEDFTDHSNPKSKQQKHLLKEVFSGYESEINQYKKEDGAVCCHLNGGERTRSVPVQLNRISCPRIEEGSLREKLFKEMSFTRINDRIHAQRPVHYSPPPVEVSFPYTNQPRLPQLFINETYQSYETTSTLLPQYRIKSPPPSVKTEQKSKSRDVGVLHKAEKSTKDRGVSPIPGNQDPIRCEKETRIEVDNFYREKIRLLTNELCQAKNIIKPQRHVGINFRPSVTDRALNTDKILSGTEVALQCNRNPETRDACIQHQPKPKDLTERYVQANAPLLSTLTQCELLKDTIRPVCKDAKNDTSGLIELEHVSTTALIEQMDKQTSTSGIMMQKSINVQTDKVTFKSRDAGCDTKSTKSTFTNTETKSVMDAGVVVQSTTKTDRASSPVSELCAEKTLIEVFKKEFKDEQFEVSFERQDDECKCDRTTIMNEDQGTLKGILKKSTAPEAEDAKKVATIYDGSEEYSRSVESIDDGQTQHEVVGTTKRSVEVCDMDDDLQELYVACLLLNEHLFEPGTTDKLRLERAVAVIQQDWFQASADDTKCSPESVARLLNVFRNFSNFLLERVVNMTDANGNSAIHHAISNGNWEIVGLLMDSGVCDVNLQNELGYTPAMLCSALILSDANSAQASAYRRIFIEGNVNIRTRQTGYTALMLASERGFVETVQMLLSAGSQVNLQDNDGHTALMKAVDNNNFNVVELLLKAGDCDINLADQKGFSAITRATKDSRKDILHLLYSSRQSKSGGSSKSKSRPVEYGNSRWIPRR